VIARTEPPIAAEPIAPPTPIVQPEPRPAQPEPVQAEPLVQPEPAAPPIVRPEPIAEAEPPVAAAEPEEETPAVDRDHDIRHLIRTANWQRNRNELAAAEATYQRVLRMERGNARALVGITRVYIARRDGLKAAIAWRDTRFPKRSP
jgi:hypothetical protein